VHAQNYTDQVAPRYAGPVAAAHRPSGAAPDTIRAVTFNVQWANRCDLAAALLEHDAALRGADGVPLQEMDEPGVNLIADSLDMGYVFYPATRHWKTGR